MASLILDLSSGDNNKILSALREISSAKEIPVEEAEQAYNLILDLYSNNKQNVQMLMLARSSIGCLDKLYPGKFDLSLFFPDKTANKRQVTNTSGSNHRSHSPTTSPHSSFVKERELNSSNSVEKAPSKFPRDIVKFCV